MRISIGVLTTAVAALTLSDAAAAQSTPAAVAAVYQCRSVNDDAARLACFDAAAAELKKAEDARTLVFGDEGDFPQFEGAEIKSKISQVRPNKSGRWVITLADGTRWLQTDRVELTFPPKAGDSITVKRGVVGNYRATTRGTTFQVRQIG